MRKNKRLERLERAVRAAYRTFEDPRFALEWLLLPPVGLNNKAPIDLLKSDKGLRQVEDLCGRIDHGVYS